jgi:hypothetical protein
LLDDFLIDSRERITRTLHPFKRKAAQPLLVPEKPWERAVYDYGTVIRDPAGGFRMWYLSFGTRPQAPHDQGLRVLVCYATSEDGLHWVRPNVGLVAIDGSKANNVVALSHSGGYIRAVTVIHNPQAPDPARRFMHLSQGPKGTGPSFSADGIHWSEGEAPVLQASDAASLAYDPRQDRFFCFSVSTPTLRGFWTRCIDMAETDLKTGRKFARILEPDKLDDAEAPKHIARLRSVLDYDNPDHYHAQLHHMVAFPYEDLHLGIVAVWDCTWSSRLEPLYAGGLDRAFVHLQLVASRDLDWKRWQRMTPRVPLLELSEPGEWDCGAQLPYHAPVRVGDELWLYYAGFSRVLNSPRLYGAGLPPGAKVPLNGIGVATLRLDGFASLDAGPRGGVIVTKPLTFEGTALRLNAKALGHITVEILDGAGEVIKGFAPVSVTGDSVRHPLAWERLAELADRPVRLRFRLWNAELYAFSFER